MDKVRQNSSPTPTPTPTPTQHQLPSLALLNESTSSLRADFSQRQKHHYFGENCVHLVAFVRYEFDDTSVEAPERAPTASGHITPFRQEPSIIVTIQSPVTPLPVPPLSQLVPADTRPNDAPPDDGKTGKTVSEWIQREVGKLSQMASKQGLNRDPPHMVHENFIVFARDENATDGFDNLDRIFAFFNENNDKWSKSALFQDAADTYVQSIEWDPWDPTSARLMHMDAYQDQVLREEANALFAEMEADLLTNKANALFAEIEAKSHADTDQTGATTMCQGPCLEHCAAEDRSTV